MLLSQGKWHEHVSRKLDENLVQRQDILDAAEKDPKLQRELRLMCKEDILFYINLFVWQFNPSRAIEGVAAIHPFITYPVQERVILARPETHAKYAPCDRGVLWCYENNKTMVCEKSRWQGASWMFLIVEDWLAIFHEYVQALNISRNEAAVDDGSKDSLFWKLRYMHERLPTWMIGPVDDTKLYFHFHRSESEITGTASTKRAGVGGRASVIFVDEFPEIEAATEVRQKTAMTANCRFFNGTHLGVGTEFQIMCDPVKSPEIVRQQMHWSENPEQNQGMYEYDEKNPNKPILHEKGYKYPDGFQFVLDGTPTGGPHPGLRSPWYDRKCIDIGDSRAIAMNLDISPEGAARQFFDGLKIRGIISQSARPPLWVGDIKFDQRGKFEELRKTPDGKLRLWVHPMGNGRLPAKKYTVGADIAAGTGATPSAVAGIDAVRSEKVLEFMDAWIEEREFAQLVSAICELLSDESGQGAYCVWDSSGQQGVKFENEFLRLDHKNIYYNDDDLSHVRAPRGASRRPGWYSSNQQKYAVLKDYRAAIYDRTLVDRSEKCLTETLLFEYDAKTGTVQHSGEIRTNDPSGARKGHGDLVTATAIAWMLAKEMAEGGRKAATVRNQFEVGTLGWLLAIDEGRRQREESYL